MRVRGLDRRLHLSTGICEPSKDWDKGKERFKQRHPNALQLNQHLDGMERTLTLYVEQRLKNQRPITPEGIKDHFKGREEIKHSLMRSFDAFLSHHCQSQAKGTTKQYQSTKVKLTQFLKAVYRISDIALEQLDYAFVTQWKAKLAEEWKSHPNTIHKNITRLRTVIHWTNRMGWLKEDPFRNYKSQTVPTVKTHLNVDDIAQLEQYTPGRTSQVAVRDAFLLMCYTGLSYSDLRLLRRQDIQNAITGGRIIKISRQKTMEYCMVPLIQKAEDIIAKYISHPVVQRRGVVMPIISNQKMNCQLEQIRKALGIQKKMTCHVARHSFATNALELGVPIETVSKALGHRSIKTTQIYARITEGKLNRDFAAFANGFTVNVKELSKAI